MSDRYPYDNTTNNISSELASQFETPLGAQKKADAARDAAELMSAEALNSHSKSGGTAHPTVSDVSAGFMSPDQNYKLNTVQSGAEVNQNSFTSIEVEGAESILSKATTDVLRLSPGVGISISTDPSTNRATIQATGTSTPGKHGLSHLTDGSDPIPTATETRSGLLSSDDKTKYDSYNDLITALEGAFLSSTEVFSFAAPGNYRAWQGVCTDGEYIYLVTDNDESGIGVRNNIITVLDMLGNFVAEKKNAYTGTDSAGNILSFGDISFIDNKLYCTLYNINSGGTPPYVSRVIIFNTYNNGFNQISVSNIGDGCAECITSYQGNLYVCYHDRQVVRKFNQSLNLLTEYTLPTTAKSEGGYQSILFKDGFVYMNMHGPNFKGEEFVGGIDKFTFDGNSFAFIETILPPTFGSTQGMDSYKDIFIFNDRTENRVIITRNIRVGNRVFSTNYSTSQKLFKLTLLAPYSIFDTTFDRAPRAYKDEKGRVYLSGMFKADSVPADPGTAAALILPKGYRPKYSSNFVGISANGAIRLPITGNNQGTPNPPGSVIPTISATGWISLDGINFLADPDEKVLT